MAAAGFLAAVVFFHGTAFAGSWKLDPGRPANENGVTNRWWDDGDGTWPAACWAWIDGNGDGVAQCYYFNEGGYLLTAPATPEGYTLDEKGAWTKDGVVQSYPNQWVPGGSVRTADTAQSVRQEQINPLQNGFSYENATHAGISDEEAYARLMQIQAELPEGTPWDDYALYVSGNRYGYGCAAFIFLVQDRLFGAPAKPYTDTSFDMAELRVGDHLRVRNNTHSVIVLTKGDGYITVAEGNYNRSVHWGRVMREDELRREFVYRETCY